MCAGPVRQTGRSWGGQSGIIVRTFNKNLGFAFVGLLASSYVCN